MHSIDILLQKNPELRTSDWFQDDEGPKYKDSAARQIAAHLTRPSCCQFAKVLNTRHYNGGHHFLTNDIAAATLHTLLLLTVYTSQ